MLGAGLDVICTALTLRMSVLEEKKNELKARSRHARLPRTKLERKVNNSATILALARHRCFPVPDAMAQDVRLTRQVQVLKMYTDVVMCSNASRNCGSQQIAPGGQGHRKAAAVTCIPSRRA